MPSLLTPHSPLVWAICVPACSIVLSCSHARGQDTVFATHDWSQLHPSQVPDTWADVKTPGDGRTYSVGTTLVGPPDSATTMATQFSTRPAIYPAGAIGAFGSPLPGGSKQVAVIQIAEPGQPAGIRGQAYFHGTGTLFQGTLHASTFARAISVWPSEDLSEMRIAICRSTRDASLPKSPTPPNLAANTGAIAPDTGFIAVYDGNLSLMWSRHFYNGHNSTHSTITDLSIRVEEDSNQQLRDYVTYCGATTRNSAVALSTMTPEKPFPAPTPSAGNTYTDGQGPGILADNWDGMVGRVSSPHLSTAPTSPTVDLDFHSVFGGTGHDALLGLSQRSLDDFVVVGVTSHNSPDPIALPLLQVGMFAGGVASFGSLQGWTLGVVARFIFPAGSSNLILLGSRVIGSPNSVTIARDVLWVDTPGGQDPIYVVGSTDFSALALETWRDPTQPVGSFSGSSSGFLLAVDEGFPIQDPQASLPTYAWLAGRYVTPPVGQHVASGAMGVANWNEYSDHIAVSGWVEYPQVLGAEVSRMLVSSCFRSPVYADGIEEFRTHQVGIPAGLPAPLTARRDYPGAHSQTQNAFNSAAPFIAAFDGPLAGGGMAVDEHGSATVVGNTLGAIAAVPPNPAIPSIAIVGPPAETRGSQLAGQLTDAVRVVVDMLPYGVHRTRPLTSTVQGTTPDCALSKFGNTLGVAALNRMFIDVEGTPGPGAMISLLVDRPVSGSFAISALWIGFPSPTPIPSFPGIDVWGNSSTPWTLVSLPLDSSIRVPLPSPLPTTSSDFTFQAISLFLPTDFCALPACTCPGAQVWDSAASPGLVISY